MDPFDGGGGKRQRTGGEGGYDPAFMKQQAGYNFSHSKMSAAVAQDAGRAKPPPCG